MGGDQDAKHTDHGEQSLSRGHASKSVQKWQVAYPISKQNALNLPADKVVSRNPNYQWLRIRYSIY